MFNKKKNQGKPVSIQGLAPEIVFLLNKNEDNIKEMSKIVHDFKNGRRLLELSPIHIRGLQYSIASKKSSLENIFGAERYAIFNVGEMKNRDIATLADYIYQVIYEGLDILLKKLDINNYMSVDKIINYGNVMKNYDGITICQGKTVRHYLTYMSKNEKPINSKFDKAAWKEMIANKLEEFKDYTKIKSMPFYLFNYKSHIELDDDKHVVVADIEAKKNLQSIITKEIYDALYGSALSLKEATVYESKLIHVIKKTLGQKLLDVYTSLEADIPEELKEDCLNATSVSSISLATKKGLVHDIVDYYETNVKMIIDISKTPDKILEEDEKKAIYQIEYQSIQKREDLDILAWSTDLKLFLEENPTYNSIVQYIKTNKKDLAE